LDGLPKIPPVLRQKRRRNNVTAAKLSVGGGFGERQVLKATYSGRQTDDIANLCFIAGKTNRQISDKPPKQYFPPMIEKSGLTAFEAQCIPTEPWLLGIEDYEAFLLRRRDLVAQRLNQFLGN